jgi:hypothetical protein
VEERPGERARVVDVLAVAAAGEAEREVGGVRVERKREAAAGVRAVGVAERRSRSGRSWRGREGSDWASGCESEGRDWRALGSLMAAEAAMGRGWTGSWLRWASSGGCMGWCAAWGGWWVERQRRAVMCFFADGSGLYGVWFFLLRSSLKVL